MACPNINSPQWKDLVNKIGVFEAMREFIKNGEEIPDAANYPETFLGVNATLKVVGALQKMTRTSYPSNQVQGFYNDLIKLGTPKNQLELLKDHIERNNIKQININDLIVSVLSEMNYTIEINTAKNKIGSNIYGRGYEPKQIIDKNFASSLGAEVGDYFVEYITEDGDPDIRTFKTLEEANQAFQSQRSTDNSSVYSNLTVPGGTNYTENEIATPAITPSIKGHAQFATGKGIGWFRSDDKLKLSINKEKVQDGLDDDGNPYYIEGDDFEKEGITKTRRILEIQSDLFQKGRDIKSPDEIIEQLKKEGKLQIKCN